MKMKPDARDDFVIESAELAGRFALAISELCRLMNLGLNNGALGRDHTPA